MEFKALILGLAFSLGLFGLKNGLGLHYLLQAKLAGLWSRFAALLAYCLAYGLIFFLAWWILKQLEVLRHIQALQQLLQSGMLLHTILAGLLLFWGLYLLKSDLSGNCRSWGWVPLVCPCPVCLMVIFFNISFLLSFFPQAGPSLPLATWAGFSALSLLTAWLMSRATSFFRVAPESFLGGAMLGIASFYLLSVIVMPQFGQLEEIYGLASYQEEEPAVKAEHGILLTALFVALFTAGFVQTRTKIKGFRLWQSERS